MLVAPPRRAAAFPGEREYAFRHALLREAAYAMLTDADRALGHRLAGEWLEQRGESDALVLAEHFERGGEPARAAALLPARRASRRSRATIPRAPRRAPSAASRAIPAGTEVGALRLVQADAFTWQGRYAESSAAAVEAMAHLEHGGPAWFRAAGEAASTSGLRGDVAALRAHLATLLAAAPIGEGDARAQMIIAASRACRQLYKVTLDREADVVCDELDVLVAALDPVSPMVLAAIDLRALIQALHHGDLGGFLDFTRARGP